MRSFARLSFLVLLAACATSTRTASAPLGAPRYDYSPSAACGTTGPGSVTVGIIAPQWDRQTSRQASAPAVVRAISPAMKQDFLEMLTCKGYLTKGPYESFEEMVYPDREASNLLLEPELQISVSVSAVRLASKGLLFGTPQPPSPTASYPAEGTAMVGGRVTLTLKEPLTNTRMWTRSIEVPAEEFQFVTQRRFIGTTTSGALEQLVLADDGMRVNLQPKLEAAYKTVLRTAENYLDLRELTTISAQAAEVRKKAAISVPK